MRVGWYDWVVINTYEAVREILEKQAVSSGQADAYDAVRTAIACSEIGGSPDYRGADHVDLCSQPGIRGEAAVVDEIPILAYLPKWLQPGRESAIKVAHAVREIKMGLWGRMEKQFDAGVAPHCFARDILENKTAWYDKGHDAEDWAWAASGLVEAGFETSAVTLNSLVLHLAADMEVQERAQEELMKVVGPGRIPRFEDLTGMPYVRACVKQMLRMNPILPPGIRHYADKDVVYKGHIIPRGTVRVANTAFLHFDPARSDTSFGFRPSRYMDHTLYSSEYSAMGDPYKRDHFTFSTGRTVCPGARLAEGSLGIALAGILLAFEIRQLLVGDVESKMELGPGAYPDAGFTIPKPFAARFVPRSTERLQIVKGEWDKATKAGYTVRGSRVNMDGMVR